MLETQTVIRALSRAWANTGKSSAARIAMTAMTTSSSIRVNALFRSRCMVALLWGSRGWPLLLSFRHGHPKHLPDAVVLGHLVVPILKSRSPLFHAPLAG